MQAGADGAHDQQRAVFAVVRRPVQLETLFEVDGTADAKSGWRVAEGAQPGLAKAIGAISLEGGAYVNSIHMNEASGDKTDIVFSDIKSGDAAMQPEEAALF
jgi:hypothetical protein